MLKKYPYILLFCIALLNTHMVAGQMAMPDIVCAGQTKHYNVDPNPVPGSTYTWWIDGVVQVGFTTNEFDHTWNSPDTYLLEVQELAANGCLGPKRSGQVFVNPLPTLTASVTQPACTVATGMITVTVPAPAAGISYTVTGTNPVVAPVTNTTGIFALLTSGVYDVTTTNSAGCVSAATTVTITAQLDPDLRYTKELSSYNGFNISCFGKSDGFIRINPSADSAPYRFNWIGPGGFASSAKDISELKAGQYVLSITDVNNCTSTETFELSEPELPGMKVVVSVSSDGGYNINCAGDNTGTISIEPLNHVGSVSYLWSDGSSDQNRRSLNAGLYSVIIIDGNNCTAESKITLTEPDSIKIVFDVTEPICADSPLGEIRSVITGGVPGTDYIYKWSDNSSGRNISNILPGEYRLIVSDLNGCTVKDSVELKSLLESCLVIPNSISPNGDLINDVWNIGNIYLYPLIEVTIFNNWGQTVWKSEKGYPRPWDGTSNGTKLPIDSYFYIFNLHNGSRPVAGSVTIIK